MHPSHYPNKRKIICDKATLSSNWLDNEYHFINRTYSIHKQQNFSTKLTYMYQQSELIINIQTGTAL